MAAEDSDQVFRLCLIRSVFISKMNELICKKYTWYNLKLYNYELEVISFNPYLLNS